MPVFRKVTAFSMVELSSLEGAKVAEDALRGPAANRARWPACSIRQRTSGCLVLDCTSI